MTQPWYANGHELFFGDGRHGQISTERFAALLAEAHNAAVRDACAAARREERERCLRALDELCRRGKPNEPGTVAQEAWCCGVQDATATLHLLE